MPFDFKLIKGINAEIEKKLFEIKIDDVTMLREATETPEKRKELSERINVSIDDLYNWSKQAELMRIEGISAEDAALLVQAGVANIEDFKSTDTETLLTSIKAIVSKSTETKKAPTLKDINSWKKGAETLVSPFVKEMPDYRYVKPLVPDTKEKVVKESGFFSDLSEMITEIGIGIAGAQHQLDLSSIDIQNKILENDELAAYGINATWYTIPEVNFNLKMEYMMVQESTESGSVPPVKRIFVSPSNAKYNNYFKSTKTEESSLSLRFVPIPPPERFTERIVMPNLLGMTREEAEEELALSHILIQVIDPTVGKTNNGKSSEVTYQSIEPGKIMRINEKPVLKVTLDS